MWSPASGQLTGCCRAFPATRAAGKRPVWCAISDNSLHLDWFLHRFSCSTEALLIPMFLPSFLFYSIPHSSSPRSPLLLQYALLFSIPLRFLHGVETPFHQGTGGDMLALLCMVLIFNSPPATSFIILSLFFFQSLSFSLFFLIKGFQCLQLFGCWRGGQKFWHGVFWMPYFHSTACLELWFVRSLACRGHFLPTVLESLYQNTDWQERIY